MYDLRFHLQPGIDDGATDLAMALQMARMAVTALALALFLSLRWMHVEPIDEPRGPVPALTGEIAARFLPLGAGVGSYVLVFEQEAPRELLMANYVNDAHNEHAQWWLVSGALAMLLAAVALTSTLRMLLRQPAHLRGLGALMAHSFVDYPLRTRRCWRWRRYWRG
ncbi:MAG TPA: hypothetical protein PK743_04290 [Luteimonas sp.]|nr:hypothetical protein [Luteimonas sp.]HRP71844.1 hypothetical protein [Luteimonas sp.]